jgi:mercuric ion binding protein
MFHHTLLMALVLIPGLILSAMTAQAKGVEPAQGVEQAILRVDGLACPFCSYGLEKKIRRLDGYKADSYEAKINVGEVSFSWKPNLPLDLDAIHQAVKKAGFTLRGIRTTVVGQITKENERYFLALHKPVDQRFHLYEVQALKELEDKARHQQEGEDSSLTEAVRNRLEEARVAGRFVRVIGPVHGHTGDEGGRPLSPAIGIEELEVLPPSEKAEGE